MQTMKLIKRVAVGMSGGVDSCVAALLLKQKSFDVVGLYMKNWDEIDEYGNNICSAEKNAEDAEQICRKLGIPFHTVNFVKEYWLDVFNNMIMDYQMGFTPNPDVLCNRHIKFGSFLQHAQNVLGSDFIATGHYARHSFGDSFEKCSPNIQPQLLIPTDRIKDQTLFLSQISSSSLQYSIFPLGSLYKVSVKNIATENGFSRILKRKESMGMCFIGNRNFKEFILNYCDPTPGRFIDIETAEVVGHHKGIHTLTVGQKCRISGKKEKYFVVSKDPQTQDILVAQGTHHPSLYCNEFYINNFNWIGSVPVDVVEREVLECKFRHINRNSIEDCNVTLTQDGSFCIKLAKPSRAITLGQYAAFYLNDRCLGSGRIFKIGPSLFDKNIKLDPNDWSLPAK